MIRIEKNKNEFLIFVFYLNDWKHLIIESWFPKKFIYVPFEFKGQATINR